MDVGAGVWLAGPAALDRLTPPIPRGLRVVPLRCSCPRVNLSPPWVKLPHPQLTAQLHLFPGMSYQVLARKWRPRSFADMVGQTHVVRALSNALDQDRLHHAYLFTGTRGVGKTTLARILAKALNCEQGVSSTPCCQCPTCHEIDEGRFVDLLEVDAASRTRVDQTRELLDNVPFAPVKGRFKVYLIDEVHMFSTSSFNALLKTLEEPPPHVKFLLATTDPQKVPVTVLSRCLQFNLKRLVPDEIAAQLAHILHAEGIGYDGQALALLARAADGSMRDGLSLLDQAIAFGGGRVEAEDIRAMLGTVGQDMSLNLLQALARSDASALLQEVARIHALTPDFGGVLQDLLVYLHRVALCQQVPATLADQDPDREMLAALARDMPPEDVQLYYQIALMGQADLPLAPDPRTGMEMVLLRMLAFRPPELGVRPGANPAGSGEQPERVMAGPLAGQADPPPPGAGLVPEPHRSPGSPPPAHKAAGVRESASVGREHRNPASAALAAAKLATAAPAKSASQRPAPPSPVEHSPAPTLAQAKPRPPVVASPAMEAPPPDLWDDWSAELSPLPVSTPTPPSTLGSPELMSAQTQSAGAASPKTLAPMAMAGGDKNHAQQAVPVRAKGEADRVAPRLATREQWHQVVEGLNLGGLASELARNCELVSWDGQCLRLILDPASRHLRVETTENRLHTALVAVLGEGLRVEIEVACPEGETPSQRRAREQRERQRAAELAMEQDPVVLALRETFGARLIPGSVRPPVSRPGLA